MLAWHLLLFEKLHRLAQMDRLRNQKTLISYRKWAIAAAVVTFAFGIALLQQMDWTTRGVDAELLRIAKVQRGDLNIEVTANGQLLSTDVEWIASQVEGRVAQVKFRAGERVISGDVLIVLNNSELRNAAESALFAVEEAEAAYVAYEVDLQNQLLNQQSIVLRAHFALEAAHLKLDAETELRRRSSIIADIDYRRTQLEVEQLRAVKRIEDERLKKSTSNLSTQLAARQAQVAQRRRALERARNKVDSLTVRAGIDGVIQQMDVKMGQHMSTGAPVARLARENQLYAELWVQARQASDIALEQSVVIDTRGGMVQGVISRIDPAVKDGTVTVDVALVGSLPANVRPELKIEGKITVAALHNTLFVGKPVYGRPGGLISVYALDKTGNYATRRSVTTGWMSVTHIEILEGLSEGEKIILSDSGDWKDHETIRLN
jgi:HlyD family secretion protein